MQHPHWRLTDREQEEAAKKGFDYEPSGHLDCRFLLKRPKDAARIFPHIDGFISCFVRQGMYVKHKKYIDLNRALDRHFSD
jgi:hypothetical protein